MEHGIEHEILIYMRGGQAFYDLPEEVKTNAQCGKKLNPLRPS